MPRVIPNLGDNPTVTDLFRYYQAISDGKDEVAAKLVAAHVTRNQPSLPIPDGIAAVWTGSQNAVPAGWELCGGQGGTPNPSTLASGYWVVRVSV